mgnify:FL=1
MHSTKSTRTTIMVTCVPVCCNKLIGPPLWLLLLMKTNNTATVVNPGAVLIDALLINTKVYFC